MAPFIPAEANGLAGSIGEVKAMLVTLLLLRVAAVLAQGYGGGSGGGSSGGPGGSYRGGISYGPGFWAIAGVVVVVVAVAGIWLFRRYRARRGTPRSTRSGSGWTDRAA